MLRNILLKSLWDQRISLPWWSLGLIAVTFMTILFYPSFRDMTEINAILGDEDSLMRAFVGDVSDLTSPEGYLNSQLYYVLIPLIFLAFAITQGSSTIAGEEERGTLDLLLSNPIGRRTVLIHKFASMVVASLLLALALWLGTILAVLSVSMDIGIIHLAEITLSAAFLGIGFGTIALCIGSSTGKRGMSIGLTSAAAIFAYLLNALAPIEDALEPFTRFSPFYYYIDSDPLTNGQDPIHTVVLIGIPLVFLVAGVLGFERRDLAT
jgi:ABC-2 type transport system permease protein